MKPIFINNVISHTIDCLEKHGQHGGTNYFFTVTLTWITAIPLHFIGLCLTSFQYNILNNGFVHLPGVPAYPVVLSFPGGSSTARPKSDRRTCPT